MTYRNIFVASIALFLTLINSVFAANKTHVADTQGAGNSRVSIAYIFASVDLSGQYDVLGGGTIFISGKETGNTLALEYMLGVTDRFDIGISMPLSDAVTADAEYKNGTDTFKQQYKTEGVGDISFIAQALLLEKQESKISWGVGLKFRPATAASDEGDSELTTNGVVTQVGKPGKAGNGYSSTRIGTLISIPAGGGDFYIEATHSVYGEKTTAGVKSKNGSDTTLSFGIEVMPSDKTTIAPYARYMNTSSGYSGTGTKLAYSIFGAGLSITQDVSKHLSVKFDGAYVKVGDIVTNYSSGDKSTMSGGGLGFNISAMTFF